MKLHKEYLATKIIVLCKIVVSELLFSAGVGCCFTQPRTPRFHHVPCYAIGHRIIFGPKAPYLNELQNPKPVVLSPIIHNSGQMMTPVIKGPSPTLPTMAATHLALRAMLLPPIYIPQLSHANRHVFQTQHSTPLHLSPPPATTVWLKSYPLKAEQARRRHGLQKERTHRPTSTLTPS
jgi:hypothetical protein